MGNSYRASEQRTGELKAKGTVNNYCCVQIRNSFQTGLALGSFCILTGLVLLFDAIYLVAANITGSRNKNVEDP
jgi:hypothetical protein